MAFEEGMEKGQACGDDADGRFDGAPDGEVVHGEGNVGVVVMELAGIDKAD